MTGELDLKEGGGGGMHFQVHSKGAPAEPFLKGFWSGKFEAKIDGDSTIDKEFKPEGKISAGGQLKFSDAEVPRCPDARPDRRPHETSGIRASWNLVN